MILNELTNADAIEAAREETWEETWEEAQQQVFDLIDQGLTGEQLKQAIERERLRTVPQTTKTENAKR
jgi:hypothetical protein